MNFKPAPVQLQIRATLSKGKLLFEDAHTLVKYSLPKRTTPDEPRDRRPVKYAVRRDGRTPIGPSRWELIDQGAVGGDPRERLGLLAFHGTAFTKTLKDKLWNNPAPDSTCEELENLYQAILEQETVTLGVEFEIEAPKRDCAHERELVTLIAGIIVQLNYTIQELC